MIKEDKVIEVRGLTKDFKEIRAVDSLSVNVYRGDVFGFLGPNGAGKSTTIRMLLTLIKPKEGSIKIFGKSLMEDRNDILKDIGAIIENPAFYNYLSAYKNLEILSRMSGREISSNKIMETLETVGLKERSASKVKTYSHGMKQRLGIAQALLHDPELIILDEPTTGLDPQGMKEIRDLINYLCNEKNKTIFLSSHILSEVELVANRMIIINKGKTVVEGKVQELLDSAEMKVTIEVDDVDATGQLIKDSGWAEKLLSTNNNKMVFDVKTDEIALLNKYLVSNNISVSAIVPTRSLEEYFLKITDESN
ncbi:MAG: ABC transporter ATP-binding protein [Ignavibacteria bacterium]|nr:ABC transporter ATP-binding protein [Ignavibacteria bacterium]